MIPPLADAARQWQRSEFRARHDRVADQDAARPQERHHQRQQFGGERLVRRGLAGADIEMGERDPGREPRARLGQRLAQIAEQQPLGRRDAIGMRGDLALADIDVASGQELAQMIVGAPAAKPQFQHHPIQAADQRGGMIEAGALRLEPADEAVKPAHAPPDYAALAAPPCSRSLRTSLSAARSWLLVDSTRWASSCMIDTAMFGNSRTMRMNGSLAMRSATSRPLARIVAARGAPVRIAMSPTISLAPRVATVTGPAGPSSTISTSPSMIR